jgi:hypothetical protein
VLLKKKALRFNAVTHQPNIQHNFRASGDFRTHRVYWDINGTNGSWVRFIEKGDIIELMVRTEYPGWVNIVKAAELEILYEHETEANKTIGLVTSPFEYIPLRSASNIRLISVHPGSFDDALSCTQLYTHSLKLSKRKTLLLLGKSISSNDDQFGI